MMWKEFEELAGYEVSYKTYTEIIEPMYVAVPNVSKQEFVKMIDKKAFALPTKAQMVREMKKIAQFIFENCGARSYHEEEDRLAEVAKQYAERFWGYTPENDVYYGFERDYAYHGARMDRGCTFPEALVINRGWKVYERIALIKE